MCMLVILFMLAYLKFASLNKQVQHAWQQLDHQLKYRADFIPGVALSAASLSDLGRDFVYQLSALKSSVPVFQNLKERVAYEEQISQSFQKVFTSAKQSSLKQDEHLSKLEVSIAETEQKIQKAKKRYNSVAHTFNIVTSIIPLNMIAKMFEMSPYDYFDFTPSNPKATEKPKWNFSQNDIM